MLCFVILSQFAYFVIADLLSIIVDQQEKIRQVIYAQAKILSPDGGDERTGLPKSLSNKTNKPT